MAEMTPTTIQIVTPEPCHLASLSTIFQRAYHPINDYIKSAMPDTPAMRMWWTTVFEEEIENPACHPLIAVDTGTGQAVGFLCQRYMEPGSTTEPRGGFWFKHAWTDDHDESKWRFIMNSLRHWEEAEMTSGQHGKEYIHLELVGVDASYQRQGIGKALHERASVIWNQMNCALYTQSGGAKEYYEQLDFDFQTLEKPEFEGYKAFISVRDARMVD